MKYFALFFFLTCQAFADEPLVNEAIDIANEAKTISSGNNQRIFNLTNDLNEVKEKSENIVKTAEQAVRQVYLKIEQLERAIAGNNANVNQQISNANEQISIMNKEIQTIKDVVERIYRVNNKEISDMKAALDGDHISKEKRIRELESAVSSMREFLAANSTLNK